MDGHRLAQVINANGSRGWSPDSSAQQVALVLLASLAPCCLPCLVCFVAVHPHGLARGENVIKMEERLPGTQTNGFVPEDSLKLS